MELKVPRPDSIRDLPNLISATGIEIAGFLTPQDMVSEILGMSAYDLTKQFKFPLPFPEELLAPLAREFFGNDLGFGVRHVQTRFDGGTVGHTEKLSARRFLHFAGQSPDGVESRQFAMTLLSRQTYPLEELPVHMGAEEEGIDYWTGQVREGDIIYMLSGGRPRIPHQGMHTLHEFNGKGSYLKIWEQELLDLDEDDEDYDE